MKIRFSSAAVFALSVFTAGLCRIHTSAVPVTDSKKISYLDLVEKLTDLECLAELPEAGEKCRQWSSYDRASLYDEATGKYTAWSANGDGSGIIRNESGLQVLAEMEGPGVIWRIWSARPGQGRVRIFLDGNTEPSVDLPFVRYFDRTQRPFTFPALVHEAAKGFNNYIPIPFKKSCKITAEKDWGNYYHFNYATYPEGTSLPTFNMNLSDAELECLEKADRKLTESLGSDPVGKRSGHVTAQRTVTVEPGATAEAFKIKGEYAITGMRVSVDDLPSAPDDRDVLRGLALSIHWDGSEEPAVWAPLGDFFGTAPGVNPYKFPAPRHDGPGLLLLLVHAL